MPTMRPLALVAALIACTAHAGGVYTWTDDHGVVHYTDRPIGPSAATQVPGMTVGTPIPDAKITPKEMPEAVRGSWCQLDRPQTSPATAPGAVGTPGHIEWHFRESSFEYHELTKDYRIIGDYSVEDATLITDQRDVGRFKIVDITSEQMTLATDVAEMQLKRGKCAATAVK